MALIIEDGSIVTNANSYITLAEARSFALDRGVTLSTDDDVLSALIFKAMDFLESKKYQGAKVNTNQSLSWPRYNVFIDGYYADSSVIPKELKNACCQLVMDSVSNVIQPNIPVSQEGALKSKSVDGVVKKEFYEAEKRTKPYFAAAESWLKKLYMSQNGFLVRV